MAREMYLVGVSEEELKPEPKAEPPKTPRAKWENFWYHYKWLFWGCMFGVVVLAVIIGQMLSVNKPDYTMILVTDNAYPDQALEALEQALEPYGQDLDGDGEVEVQVVSIYLHADNSTVYYTNAQSLQVHLASGDIMFFAYEPEYYQKYVTDLASDEYTFLTPLEIQVPGIREDGLSWNWNGDSRVQTNEILSAMPQDLYFGVRTAVGTASKEGDTQQACLELLRAFAQDQPTGVVTAPAE